MAANLHENFHITCREIKIIPELLQAVASATVKVKSF
jgi:hypothetical protein